MDAAIRKGMFPWGKPGKCARFPSSSLYVSLPKGSHRSHVVFVKLLNSSPSFLQVSAKPLNGSVWFSLSVPQWILEGLKNNCTISTSLFNILEGFSISLRIKDHMLCEGIFEILQEPATQGDSYSPLDDRVHAGSLCTEEWQDLHLTPESYRSK